MNERKPISDEWYTPKWVIDALGPFDLDPCSPAERPFDTAAVHWTKSQDGLLMPWGIGRVWLNPPYSKDLLRAFVERLAAHGNGIALLKNRTDNVLFHEVIFPKADSMLFVRKRIQFLTPDGKKGNPFSGSLGYKTSDSFRSAAQCICNHAASPDGQASQAFISAIIGKMMEERMKSFSVKNGNTHLN